MTILLTLVSAMGIFVHLANPQRAINEFARVCKPDGVVVAETITPYRLWKIRYKYDWGIKKSLLRPIYFSSFVSKIRPFLHNRFGLPLEAPCTEKYVKKISEEEFESYFIKAGLPIKEIRRTGPSYSPVFVIVSAQKKIT